MKDAARCQDVNDIAIRPLTLEKYRRRNVKAVAELFHLPPVEFSRVAAAGVDVNSRAFVGIKVSTGDFRAAHTDSIL